MLCCRAAFGRCEADSEVSSEAGSPGGASPEEEAGDSGGGGQWSLFLSNPMYSGDEDSGPTDVYLLGHAAAQVSSDEVAILLETAAYDSWPAFEAERSVARAAQVGFSLAFVLGVVKPFFFFPCFFFFFLDLVGAGCRGTGLARHRLRLLACFPLVVGWSCVLVCSPSLIDSFPNKN